MIDPALASDAVATMHGDRMRTHGNPADTLARIAQMWTGYLGKDIHPTDVAQMMVMVKQAVKQAVKLHQPSCTHRPMQGEVAGEET